MGHPGRSPVYERIRSSCAPWKARRLGSRLTARRVLPGRESGRSPASKFEWPAEPGNPRVFRPHRLAGAGPRGVQKGESPALGGTRWKFAPPTTKARANLKVATRIEKIPTNSTLHIASVSGFSN